ncbi:MAG: alpha/beta fold hydrolase [Saprospiraceae bacterium]|nr:alpha/beta fold hydrolase [Saprospiraceae bacterium]
MRAGILFFLIAILAGSCYREEITFSTNANDVFYVENDGASMRVQVRGNTESRSFLIVVHGGPGASSYKYMTRKMEALMHPETAVVYFDQRNAGASQGNNNVDYADLEQYALDLSDVIEVLKSRYGEDISLFILSKSFGGMVACQYMTRAGRPDEAIKGWIYANATHNYPLNDSLSHEMMLRLGRDYLDAGVNTNKWLEILNYCESVAPPFSFEQSLKINLLARRAQTIVPEVKPYSENPIWDNLFSEHIPITAYYLGRTNSLWRKFNRVLHNLEFRESLSNVTVPVLVCTARFDFLCPSGLAADFYARVSSADKKYLMFEFSTHNFEEEDAYYQAFITFVKEHR